MKIITNILILFGSFFILSACSSDDDGSPDIPGEHNGSVSFQVSGEVEGEYSGIADFRAFEMSGIHTWDITMLDQDPITFSVSFTQVGNEPIDRPETGTYELGINPGNQLDDIYMASFEYYVDGPFQSDSYTVGIGDTTGELEITSSSDERIEGNFSFTAVRLDDEGNLGETISVTDGEFSAVPRQ
ncbi:DUF6252 family protein [Pleomorphovibrio marinus]|uniref:DUF6252 family protein n=1 Tax=Pleomorphovibrio marinus TaxID=2164132 RepID=UPI000E0C87CB|nr:DUF6252 family protein [Pleomorphovibrio marinus]